MANNTTQYSLPPQPVPTPYQPVSKGGNVNIPVGSTGPAYSATSPGPYITYGQNSGGMTNPTNQTQTGTSANWITQQSTQPYTQTTQPIQQTQTYIPGTANNNNQARISGINPTAGDINPADRNAWAIANGYTGWDDYMNQQRQRSYDSEINAQIESMYGPTMDILNQNIGLVGGQKTAAEQQAEADYQANLAQLGTQKGTTLGGLETQQRKGQTQKEDALAQARRLYSELQRGNIQRFGGATSAGQAASEIQGAEQQRQFGQTARQFNEFTQQIETARKDVESQYQTGIQQLNQAKQTAMAKIQSDFTNAIMQINNMRAQTEQQKGAAKLQALQQLRSEAQALQQQTTQFQQQLDLMREQANLNIQQYAKTTGAAGTYGTNAYNTLSGQYAQSPTYSQVQGSVGQNLGNQYVGAIRKPEDWQYQGSIGKYVVGKTEDGRTLYSDGTAGWTQY